MRVFEVSASKSKNRTLRIKRERHPGKRCAQHVGWSLPNEANTARAASSSGKNAATAGEVLPLMAICIYRRRMGSNSPVVAIRASTSFVGATSCLVVVRAISQHS